MKPSQLPEEFLKCNVIKEKEARIDCKFDSLHKLTVSQDLMNLDIRKEINDSTDPRWLPIHIIDDANAIILETSLYQGRPIPDYIKEKSDALAIKLFTYLQTK